MKRTFVASPDNPKVAMVIDTARVEIMRRIQSGEPCEIEVREPRRTLDQNAAMWATLTDFQVHVKWMVSDQYGNQVPATTEDVKDILTSAFEGETRMAPGLRGGVVILGARTSKYGKKKMGQFLTFVHAEGDERGVRWSDKALEDLAQWAPAERAA